MSHDELIKMKPVSVIGRVVVAGDGRGESW
jgi:hypothetical protein